MCLYAYYEKDDLYKNNFKFFLENWIIPNVDYYIIINRNCSINIHETNNIIVYKRENKGYDFGAYSFAINNIDKINKDYDYYFFMNTSVKGPYLNGNNKDWTKVFLNLFNKDVSIVGTSINIYENNNFYKFNLKDIYNKDGPFSHVQSMFFCINKDYLDYLKSINFFNEEEINNISNIDELISYKEFGLSQNAIKKGNNINCILSKYKDLDYRLIKKDINETSYGGDSYYKDSYFGGNIDPYEVIFYKNNRDIVI